MWDDMSLEEAYEDDDTIVAATDLVALRAFGVDTKIETAKGPKSASQLIEGDRIRAKTGELVEIDWIETIHLDADFLERHPGMRPVLFCLDDLGSGSPKRNTIMSPAQMIWSDSEGYRSASQLSKHPSVFRSSAISVSYIAFTCRKPTVVNADGLWVSVAP